LQAVVLSILTSILAALLLKYALNFRRLKRLGTLFSFGPGSLIFVVPHRGQDTDSIMPRVAIEDVLAMRNILLAAGEIDRATDIVIRDPDHLTSEDRKQNLIVLGGPNVNSVTADFLKDLGRDIPFEFKKISTGESTEWSFYREPGTYHSSPSYKVPNNLGPTEERKDFGLFAKLGNPANQASHIFLVAGLRGIGTWGAANFARNKAKEILRRKRRHKLFKRGSFALLVAITYRDFDIADTTMIDFIDLNGAS
jgi:hypothetical protein